MKKKIAPETAGKNAVGKPEPIQNKVLAEEQMPSAALTGGEKLHLVLFFVAASLSMIVTTGVLSIALLVVFLLFSLRKNCLQIARENLSLPMVAIFCMLALYGAAAIYSPFGETATLELYRGISAMILAGYALLHFEKKHVPALLWGFVIIVTVYTFLSFDMAASRIFFTPAFAVMKLFGVTLQGVSAYPGRLYGLLNNSNVMAGISSLGLIVGLYQMQTEKDKTLRCFAALCLGINAVVFWLGYSRGGMLCFGVSMIVYLVLTRKGERLRLFILMLICVVVTIALGTVAGTMMSNDGGSVFANLLAVACGLIILGLDSLISVRFSELIQKHRKVMLATGGVAIAVGAAFVICAATISGPYAFPGGAGLARSVSLAPGQTYTVAGDWDGDPMLTVVVEGKDDLLMDWGTTIYSGPLAGAEFTLPEDNATVMLYFGGQDGEELREVTFSDGTSVKLDLKLLPEVLEGRLQDKLLTSSSLLLRLQYIKDGLKIWSVSPVFGRGLTSTDNLYPSVQPVFYMSKFAHCHIIQYLADMGIVGLACFLTIVVGLAWLLLRKRKESRDPLTVAFLVALVMMNLHSAMEINFSVRAFAITGYVLLGIMAIAYGEPLLLKGKESVRKAADAAAVSFYAVAVFLAVICGANRLVNHWAVTFETTDHAQFMKKVETFINLDVLDDDYYKILYMAQHEGVAEYVPQVEKYAKQLRASGAFTNCDAASRYFYLPYGMLDEIFVCSMEGIAQKASDPKAWNGELDFFRATVLPRFANDWANAEDSFVQGVLSVRDYLAMYSQGRMEEIALSEDNVAFIQAVEAVWQNPDMTPEQSLELLMQYSYAESEA